MYATLNPKRLILSISISSILALVVLVMTPSHSTLAAVGIQSALAAELPSSEIGPVPQYAEARIGKGAIRNVIISPDERRIAISTPIGVYMYDTATMNQMWYSEAYDPLTIPIAFSHDSTRLVGNHGYGHLVGWDVETGNIYAHYDYEYGVFGVTFSGDDKYVLAPDGATVLAWDANTGQFLYWKMNPSIALEVIAGSPDGTMFATAGDPSDIPKFKEVAVFDTATGLVKNTFDFDSSEPLISATALQFTPDNQYLAAGFTDIATGSSKAWVKLWNLADGTLRYTIRAQGGYINQIGFSPDGKQMAVGTSRIYIYNVSSGALVKSYSQLPVADYGPWYSNNGTLKSLVLTGQNTVKILAPATGEESAPIEGHLTPSSSGFLSVDGTKLFLGKTNGRVEIRDAATKAVMATLKGADSTNSTIRIAMSDDGSMLTALFFYNLDDIRTSISTWNLTTGQKLYTLPDNNLTISRISLSHDGTSLLVGQSNGWITRRNAQTGAVVERIKALESGWALAFSSDGTRAALRQDNQVTFADLATGTSPIAAPFAPEISDVNFGEFSSDGSLFAAGDQFKYDSAIVNVWDTVTGQLLHTINDGADHSIFAGVTAIAFSADNRTLYAGLYDGAILICDVAGGTVTRTLQGHGDAVRWLGLSPMSGHLISVSEDGTVVFWQLP